MCRAVHLYSYTSKTFQFININYLYLIWICHVTLRHAGCNIQPMTLHCAAQLRNNRRPGDMHHTAQHFFPKQNTNKLKLPICTVMVALWLDMEFLDPTVKLFIFQNFCFYSFLMLSSGWYKGLNYRVQSSCLAIVPASQPTNTPYFLEHEGSYTCSQQPSTFPQPDQSRPQPPMLSVRPILV